VVVHETLDMVDLDVWLGSKSELIFVPVSTVVSCFSFWGPPEERRVLRDIHSMQIVETPQSGKNLNPSSGKIPERTQ
jgi:hypothetical protein